MITSFVLGGLSGYLIWTMKSKLTGFIVSLLPVELELEQDELLLLGFALSLLVLGFIDLILGLHFRLFWVAIGTILGYFGPKIWDYFKPVI